MRGRKFRPRSVGHLYLGHPPASISRNAPGTGGYDMDIIHIGDVFNYTIPSFNVITVKVQHGVTSVWDESQRKTLQ